jgi:hypothetical protein
MIENPDAKEIAMEDDDRQEVLIDDEMWELAQKLSGLDDPTPFLMRLLIEEMKQRKQDPI